MVGSNARQQVEGKRGLIRRVGLLVLLVVTLAGMSGCAGRQGEKISLVLISPHRDEIRLETSQAFRDWFNARTVSRLAAVRAGLQAWLRAPEDKQAEEVSRLVRIALADWRNDDFAQLRQAFQDWRTSPTRAHGEALLAAIEAQEKQIPEAELVWQDIGGGTGQIARYVNARFESLPEGIGIDLLFGGGTDIYLRFAQQGLLQALQLPAELSEGRIRRELNGIPLYDAQHRWFGPMLSSFGNT